MIALVFVGSALFVGTWFQNSIAFADAHSLDAARTARPTSCTFNTDDVIAKVTGTIHVRDGFMRFDIRNAPDNADTFEWAMEIDMNNPDRMMSRASPQQPFVSLDDYPDVRVQALEELKTFISSDKLHCAPWWSASSYRFELQGHL